MVARSRGFVLFQGKILLVWAIDRSEHTIWLAALSRRSRQAYMHLHEKPAG
jgi:hypothetical protein